MKQSTFLNYEIPEIPKGMIQIKFLKSVPKFVGIDIKVYGPFSEGDKAIIPITNSVGLIKKKGATTIC